MEASEWKIQDTVSFEPNVGEEKFAVVVGVKYNNDYDYRNLYLRYTTQDSLGQTIDSKLMDVPLFESASGAPLGKGFGSTFTKYDTLPISKAFTTIELLQYMRVDTLQGIEAVGVKVVKK
jgi:gliding motility-associated lipoprotein GldH